MSRITIAVNVFNHTNEDMILEAKHLDHGKWIDKPENIINGRSGDFVAGNGISRSVEGEVSWQGKRTHDNFTILFDKPLNGTTKFAVECSNRFRYTISGDPQEKHALVSVSFYKQELNPITTQK